MCQGLDNGLGYCDLHRTLLIASRCYQGPTVVVLVGPNEQSFNIHIGILTHNSSFFKSRLLSEGWGEAQQEAVTLNEEIPAVFLLVVRWMYTGRMSDAFITVDMNTGNAYEKTTSSQVLSQKELLSAWLLAEYLNMPALCNHSANLIFAAISPSQEVNYNGGLVKMAFENKTPAGQLRRLLLEAASVGFISLRKEFSDVEGDALSG